MLVLGWTGDDVHYQTPRLPASPNPATLISPVVGKTDTEPAAVSKEVVGIHVLLTRSLFDDGILRRLLLRVSLAKPIFAALRF